MDNPTPVMVNPLSGQGFAMEDAVPAMVGGPSMSSDPAAPPKRRPGRPKGSGKKYVDSPDQPKIKRPVGRPRKDGLPAGSIGPRRSVRPRKSAPARIDSAGQSLPTGFPYGQAWPTGFPPAGYIPQSASSSGNHGPSAYSIDPALERDNWAELARTKSPAFLTALLVALAAPNPISTAGPSVEEAFKSHLVSLAPTAVQVKTNQPIPSLYSILKTFWLPSSPAYFSLTASASTARTPSEHRFLYWDPQPLVFNGIACPNCAAPLINRGRIRSGPVKIYDLENPFFIIGCEYVCRSAACIASTSPEGRKFASTDTSILRSLPTRLKDEFPAYLNQGDGDAGSGTDVWNWQAMGVSRPLWNMVRACLKSGLGKAVILQLVRAIQYGVPDDFETKEEEEEADAEDTEHEQLKHSTDANGPPNVSDNGHKDFTDAYQNAWKAHTAVVDSDPTRSDAEPHASSSGVTTVQTFSLPGGPYIPYPYAAYFNQRAPSASATGPSTSHTAGDKLGDDDGNADAGPSEGTTENGLKRPYTFTADSGLQVEGNAEPSQKRTRHCSSVTSELDGCGHTGSAPFSTATVIASRNSTAGASQMEAAPYMNPASDVSNTGDGAVLQEPRLERALKHGKDATLVVSTALGGHVDALPEQPSVSRTLSRTPTIPTPTSGGGTAPVGDLTAQITTEIDAVAHGGFSDIYRGEWNHEVVDDHGAVSSEKRQIVVKLLRVLTRQQFDMERAKKRLNRELYVWHRLDHANIARFHGVTYHLGGRPAMVMEWYHNGSAPNYLKRNPDLDPLPMAMDVTRGLTYLHNLDPPIIHGDLKGNNILVTDDGHAILSDFGLSQALEDLGGPSGNTTGSIAGTIRWQAPELMFDDDADTLQLTIESDVWSFACTIFELITRNLPYPYRQYDWNVIHDIMNKRLPGKPQDLGVDENDTLWKIIERCWSYDIPSRPAMTAVESQMTRMLLDRNGKNR